MATVEERLAAVEQELAEIKKLGGVPGPRGLEGIRGPQGKPGDISAALGNVERAAPQLILDALKSLNFITEKGELRGLTGARGRDGVDGHTPGRSELETILYRLLHECGILTDGSVGDLLLNEIRNAVLVAVQEELPKALADKK